MVFIHGHIGDKYSHIWDHSSQIEDKKHSHHKHILSYHVTDMVISKTSTVMLVTYTVIYSHIQSVPNRHLQFKHFPNSKNISESRFPKKYYLITILKEKMERFDQYFKK